MKFEVARMDNIVGVNPRAVGTGVLGVFLAKLALYLQT